MAVQLTCRRGYGPLGRFLRPRARRLLRLVERPEAELSVLLCGDEEMRRLNGHYRGRDRGTDVLAFSQQEGPGPAQPAPLLGDVVICIDQARRQAGRKPGALQRELLLLLVHGTLHLLGYEHEGVGASRARRMEQRQRQLLDLLLRGRGTPR